MKKQKASSKLFFEEASKKLRRGGYLEEGEVLPSLDDEDEIIATEEEDENEEARDKVKARIARNIRNRMRNKSRSRVAKKKLYEEDEDEEILINKEIELEDDMDEDPDYVDDESVVTEEEDENEEELLGQIAKAVNPRSRQRVKNKLAKTRRYKEQFGSIIADNIDFKVLREKLSKVKLSSHESIKRRNSYVSRANKFGAFRLYDGIKLREGKIKFRANGSVESFKVSR